MEFFLLLISVLICVYILPNILAAIIVLTLIIYQVVKVLVFIAYYWIKGDGHAKDN